jgi:endonuclease G
MKKFLIALNVFIWGFVAYQANANPIDDVCPQHVVWGAPQIKKEGANQYLCRTGYAVNYNYQTKVAHFVVETIKPENLVRTAARKDDFREDPEIPTQYRVTLKEYVGSGLDRGHMAPAANFMNSEQMMSESFLLTNMMPQNPGNNRGIWKYTEEMARYYAQKYGQMYVITGTIFDQNSKTFGNNVYIPSYLYKIIIDAKNQRAIAFLFPNVKLDPKTIEQFVVSIGEIEDYTGINFSPALPANLQSLEKNRAVYKDW